ncbi:MAG: GMC family oxidoreductase [Spirochaetes bacterium]|nr:GMC family oxidoreductase [Spirochaetota bacterium]
MTTIKRYTADVLVIGSGPGATSFTHELIKKNACSIIVAEKGKRDSDLGAGVDQRGKRIYMENGSFPRSAEGIIYYRHFGLGGTLEISCGNGVRLSDRDLAALGIDIGNEMDEVEAEIGVTPFPDSHLGSNSALMLSAANDLGYPMRPMPKFIDFEKCSGCAMCECICPRGAKWSSGRLLESHERDGSLTLLDGVRIEKIIMVGGVGRHAEGVSEDGPVIIEARAFVLAGGALCTPVILQNSGFRAGSNFFMDLYTVVYGKSKNFRIGRDVPMPAFYHHHDDSFLVSPYLDPELWFLLHRRNVAKWLNGRNIDGLMVKTKDEPSGMINRDGSISKTVTEKDTMTMKAGIDIARDILIRCGSHEQDITVTAPRGAHPGGTAAIGQVVDEDLRVMNSDNLYVADSSLFPESLGKPPIVAIMALGKRLARSIPV